MRFRKDTTVQQRFNFESLLLDTEGSGGEREHEYWGVCNETINSSLDGSLVIITSDRFYKLLLAFIEDIKQMNFSTRGSAAGRGV